MLPAAHFSSFLYLTVVYIRKYCTHRDTNTNKIPREQSVAIFSEHTNIKITIPKEWQTLRKTSCYWTEEYATN